MERTPEEIALDSTVEKILRTPTGHLGITFGRTIQNIVAMAQQPIPSRDMRFSFARIGAVTVGKGPTSGQWLWAMPGSDIPVSVADFINTETVD